MSVCVRFGVPVEVKGQFAEIILFSYHVGYRHPTQIVRNDKRYI